MAIMPFYVRIRWVRRVRKDANHNFLRSFLMKKTIFALFAVMLVLSLATCDLLEPPDAAKSVAPEGMVTIKINVVGLGRAVNLENSSPDVSVPGPGAADYYEVVFRNGTNYYGKAWDGGSTGSGTITIPVANYSGTGNDAVLLAGFKSNFTLLGVGHITAGGDLTSGGNTVTFNVAALVNGVGSTSASSRNSTFRITGPTTPNGDDFNGWDYATASTQNSDAFTRLTGNIPIFPVPGYDTVGSQAYTAQDIKGAYSITIPDGAKVVLSGVTPVTVTSVSLGSWPEQGTNHNTTEGGGVSYTYSNIAPTPNPTTKALADGQNTINFDIDVSGVDENGLSAFKVEATVRGLGTPATYANVGATTPVPWVIRGGTSPNTVDNGGTGNGAAVILAVGTHANFTRGISVSDPDWPVP
jgi:predicted small lipoprotein YifL